MIKAEERYLLLQAGFTERQINTQMQKFYNLFRVAPMPQMNKAWVSLTSKEREMLRDEYGDDPSGLISEMQMMLKDKNNG